MSATTKRSNLHSVDPTTIILGGGFALLIAAVGAAWVALRIADKVTGQDTTAGRGPIDVAFALVNGEVSWSTTATFAAAATVVACGALITGAVKLYRWQVAPALPVDRAAPHMGKGHQVDALREKQVRATARRLKCETDSFGLQIGKAVLGGWSVWSGFEDVSVDIWGPRSGKTTSRAIPALVSAPGARLATSNKRDIVDATRDLCAAQGGEDVWVFDPMGLVDEPATWWWNPLTFVKDEVSAMRLAKVFIDATREPGARTDAYFDGAARDLLAGMLLAAARGGRPITDVFLWLSDSSEAEPQDILTRAGHTLMAASVDEVLRLPDRQRAGVYGSAKQIVSFLINGQATQWVTPGAGREFNPDEFVRSKGTLYSLSKEGVGTAGPLVLALNVAVLVAAEEYAKHQRDGRLAVPMVVVLDEAANVCRWQELPDMYSHFGSRGIIVMTFLQSWDQGVAVWGRDGMRKLWNAATVRVYGGGTADPEFLDMVSKLIGFYERISRSVSNSRHGGSSSWQPTSEPILDVADLGALPRGRVVVAAAGCRPLLVKPVPWMAGPHKEAIEASWRRHNPSGLVEAASPWTAVDDAPVVAA